MTLAGNLATEQRLEWLRQRLDQTGQVLILDAATALDVSEMTVRRDLSDLVRLVNALVGAHDLTVVTNGHQSFLALQGKPGVSPVLTGGHARPAQRPPGRTGRAAIRRDLPAVAPVR